jgi:hypothetical protein
VTGYLHASAALFLGRSPWYPSDRRLGRPKGQSGHWSREKSCPCWESNAGHPASSLFQLRYPSSLIIIIITIMGKNDEEDDTVWFEYLAIKLFKLLTLWIWLIL